MHLDDSTGKGRSFSMRERKEVLFALFFASMCSGLIIAERLYISSNREDILHATALPSRPKPSRAEAAQQQQQQQAANQAAASAEAIMQYPKDAQMLELEAYLQKVAPSREVLLGVSNINPLREGMLDTFLKGVTQAAVTNYVIVALDKETEADLLARNFNSFYMPIQISKSQADTGANHAVSALKFGIIKKFLMLGWAVLLSDIDICVLQDPFKHLYR